MAKYIITAMVEFEDNWVENAEEAAYLADTAIYLTNGVISVRNTVATSMERAGVLV